MLVEPRPMNPRVRRLWRFLWTGRHEAAQIVPSDPPSIVRRLVTGVILILLLGVGLAVALAWLARALRDLRTDWSAQLSERNAEVDRRLVGVTETMDRRLGELDTKVDRRLENASHTANKIHERLGKVDEETTQMLDRAKDLARLEQALRPPKARGGFGELLLENLLRDRLPPSAYEMQYTFDSGERVDALVKVDRTIPIDSKFPLDNYNRLVEAESDDERTLAERQFARDVKQHIEAIAAKYIRPDEGTYDFAFMYIPVEAVYYELACGKTGALLGYAHERRVFPVSPTTFTAYLQVIALGLRGLQVEQHAHEVMAYVADLQRDFNRFADDFDKVGTHVQHAQCEEHATAKLLDHMETEVQIVGGDQTEIWAETVLKVPGPSADAA